MTQHPITPPQWQIDAWQARIETMGADVPAILLEAAQWGADQELEACCELVRDNDGYDAGRALLAERRIHSLSLKQQALQAIGRFSSNAHTTANEMTADFELLRQIVEQLDD